MPSGAPCVTRIIRPATAGSHNASQGVAIVTARQRLLCNDAVIGFSAALVAFLVTLIAGVADVVLLDFQVYRWAGNQALSDGFLYTTNEPVTSLPYLYPPFAALLFAPFAVMPPVVAQATWTALSIAGLARACHLLCKAGRLESGRALPHGFWVLLSLSVLLEPVQQTLLFGQVNLMVMWLVVEGILHNHRRHASVSLLAGIAAGIKVTPIVFLSGLAFTKSCWSRAVFTLVGFVASIVVGFLAFPGESLIYWEVVVRDTERVGVGYIGNQSLSGVIFRLTEEGFSSLALSLLSATVLIWAIFLARRSCASGDGIMGLCILASGMLLASPLSWTHHWVWVVLLLAHSLYRLWPLWRRVLAVAMIGIVFSTYVIWGASHGGTEPGSYSWLEFAQGGVYTWSALALLVWGSFHYRARDTSDSSVRHLMEPVVPA